MYEGGDGETVGGRRRGERMTAYAKDRPPLFSPIRSANPAGGGADQHSHLPASLHLVRAPDGRESDFLLYFHHRARSVTLIPLLLGSICYTHSRHTLRGSPGL